MSGYIKPIGDVIATDLPYDFCDAPAVVYNDKIHILGSNDINATVKHYSYDGINWTPEADIPYMYIIHGAAVVYNNKIHIMGGYNNAMAHYSYDGTLWTEESTLPYEFKYGSAVVYNNKIHILGSGTYTTNHYSWDGSTWTEESTLPYRFAGGSAVVYNNKIHILGSGTYTTNHYSWDGSTWTSVSTLPYDFRYGSAVVHNNKIYITGGNSSGTYSWNGTTWIQEIDTPYQVYDGWLLEYQGIMHILGGSWQATDRIKHYVFDDSTNEWVSRIDRGEIEKIRKGWIEAVDRSKIYKITEKTAVQAPFSNDNSVKTVIYNDIPHIFLLSSGGTEHRHYSYNGTTWTEESILPYDALEPSVITYNGKIHLIGGGLSDDDKGKSHYTWDGTSWTKESDLPFYLRASWNATVVYNDKIYIVSGAHSSIKNYLYSYNGTSWTKESTLPKSDVFYASAVVYDDKIHIMGDYNHPDSHYAWDGTSWKNYPNMPFNNYGGPSFVHGKNVQTIDVIYGTKHFQWYSGGWYIDDGESVSILPYSCTYPGIYVEEDMRTTHLIAGKNDSTQITDNHFIYNYSDSTWETEIELKELVQPSEVSIYDDIRFGYIMKQIKKAWVGELNGSPKLVLRTVPIIEDPISFGNNVPNNMINGDFSSYRMAAVSLYDRIHILGGTNNVHYSFKVSYDNDPSSAYIGRPIALDLRKESTLPYQFCGDTAFVLDDEIHIFGSNYHTDLRMNHYVYRNRTWVNVNESQHQSVYPNKSAAVQVENDIYIFYEDQILKYHWNPSNDSGTWAGSGSISGYPIYIDNSVYAGWESAVYDKDNNRIILVYYNNAKTYFYSFDLSYSSSLTTMANNMTLLKTVNNDYFLHPLYLDETVVPNGGNDVLHLLGGTISNDYSTEYTNKGHLKYDGSSWNARTFDLPYSFVGGSAVMYNGKIHIMGGTYGQTSHYSYDGFEWTQETNLPYSFVGGSAVVYNNRIYIMGGYNSNNRHFYYWDGSSWYSAGSLPYNFYNGSAAVYDNKIHLLGGTDSGSGDAYWSTKTWSGLTDIDEFLIWTDGNSIYYSNGSSQYVLNKSTSTWSKKTWNGLTSFDGSYIWTDGTNIYYSSYSDQYVLNKSTSTWSKKTWSGYTSISGQYIWTDGTNIYYSSYSDQYVLNKSTSTWSTKTWNGLTRFPGFNIWTDGTNIYYSDSSNQYVLNKSTSTWNVKTWNGLTNFIGSNIWTDGTNYYYSRSSTQYVLDKATSTWSVKTWNGLTSFNGDNIWTDGIDIYYSNGSNQQYVLNKPVLNSLKHYCYNGSSWTQKRDNPYEFTNGFSVVYNNRLYILGGSGNYRGFYYYTNDSWTWAGTNLPSTGVGDGAVTVYNNRIYIIVGDRYNYSSVYYYNNSQWISDGVIGDRTSISNKPAAIVMTEPSKHYIVGWTEIDNSNLSSSGLGAFSITSDPTLNDCISWTWSGHYPHGSTISNMQYNPAVTVAHNGRIFMINIDGGDTADSPVINELKLSRWTEYSATFDHYNDDVLGKLNINNLAYDNHNLYTYGGSYSYNSPTPRIPLYLYEYDSRRSLFKWQKINITSLDGFSAINLDLDVGKNVSVVYNNGPMIFTNASIWYNYNDQQMSQDIVLILTINSSGVLKGEVFGSINASIPVLPNDKLYYINYNYCYGSFVYNNMIYFLGGAYNSSMTNAMKRITKYDPVNKTLEYVGKIWDTPNNTMTSSPIDLPYKQNLPYKLDKFGYGVIGNDLHIVYSQSNMVWHKILDLSTEANYYQFNSKKELPLSEPLRDATPPPSTFCGPCFTSDDFFMAICKDNDQYQIYNLIEYFEHIVYEEIDLDTYDYRCRWEVINDDLEIYSDVGDGYIKHITLNKRNNSSIQNIEILTDDDGIAAQYETKLDEYFK